MKRKRRFVPSSAEDHRLCESLRKLGLVRYTTGRRDNKPDGYEVTNKGRSQLRLRLGDDSAALRLLSRASIQK